MSGRGSGEVGYEVPEGLQELLIEFTVSVLVEQPSDLLSYASDYFQRLREEKSQLPLVSEPDYRASDDEDESPMEGKSPTRI